MIILKQICININNHFVDRSIMKLYWHQIKKDQYYSFAPFSVKIAVNGHYLEEW